MECFRLDACANIKSMGERLRRFYLVCYDIADRRRLARVARLMEGYGERVQESVFECLLDEGRFRALIREVERELDIEHDHVRYYTLCAKDRADIQVDGIGPVADMGVMRMV